VFHRRFQCFHKAGRVIAIYPFEHPNKEKAIATITVVAKIFQFVNTTPAVEVDVAGRFIVVIERIQKVTTSPPKIKPKTRKIPANQ